MTKNTLFNNRLAQAESGPLQALFLGLIVVAAAGFSFFFFIDSLQTNYDTPELERESSFRVYQETANETTRELEEIRSVLGDDDSGLLEIASVMISRGFRALTNIMLGPFRIAATVINSAFEVLQLPTFLKQMAVYAILAVVLFAIIALIMKVRA